MPKNKQKTTSAPQGGAKCPKLTTIGRFVAWADEVDVTTKIAAGERITMLLFLISVAGLVVLQQNSGWDLFRNKAPAQTPSTLPQFSPDQETMNSGGMLCDSRTTDVKNSVAGEYSMTQFALKMNIAKLVADKPMERMLEAVSKRDPQTATYLVAIAKKESNLGKTSPKDASGNDCFNYWGFRGTYNRTRSGYSCFDSPEQAVAVVGDRIQFLSQAENLDTPAKMSVWKCGYDCSWDNKAAVKKWIADVGYYYDKLSNNL